MNDVNDMMIEAAKLIIKIMRMSNEIAHFKQPKKTNPTPLVTLLVYIFLSTTFALWQYPTLTTSLSSSSTISRLIKDSIYTDAKVISFYLFGALLR